MKFYFTLVVATILTLNTVNAQHANIGFKAGLNSYNISTNSGSSYDSKLGLNIGMFGHIHLSKQVAFQPEIVYSSQGAKYTYLGTETNINLDYINVPLLLQYMFENGFRLEVGPQIGFLASAKSKTNNSTSDIKNDIKGIDLGLAIGLGYVDPKSGFGVDARYNLGLSNINNNSNTTAKNVGYQFGIFYLLGHK
jgi:hypothetical protein